MRHLVHDRSLIDTPPMPHSLRCSVVYDNYGAKGTADKAMPKIKPGGTYLLLPGGEGGALSKHPKPGVKQVNFGLMYARQTQRRILYAVPSGLID